MAQRSGGGPEPLGDPPNDLSARPLPLVSYSGTAYRIHWVDHAPIHFGKEKKWRFDDPLGEYGVMYASHTPEGAFAETLLPPPGLLTPTLSLIAGSVPVSATTIGVHALAEVRCDAILHCVDLTGEKLASVGADASIATGAWRISQRWSRAFFYAPFTARRPHVPFQTRPVIAGAGPARSRRPKDYGDVAWGTPRASAHSITCTNRRSLSHSNHSELSASASIPPGDPRTSGPGRRSRGIPAA